MIHITYCATLVQLLLQFTAVLPLLINLVTILLCVQSLTWTKLVIQCNYILLAIQYNAITDATYNATTCTGFSLRAGHQQIDWNLVKKILLAWFDNLGNVFLTKKFSSKRLYLPVKTSYPPVENVTEIPACKLCNTYPITQCDYLWY